MNELPSLNRNRDFQLLWAGQAMSALGCHASWIAFPLLVLQMTGSALQAALVAAVSTGVGLLAGLPGGLVADRHNRRAVMLACDLGCGLAMLTLVVALVYGWASLPVILVLAAVDSALGCAFSPAATATLRLIVPTEQLPSAIARNQARSAAATLAGPALGGALFGVSPVLPFLVDALSYAASFACILGIRATGRGGNGRAHAGGGLLSGLRFVWRHPSLRYALANAAVTNFAFGGLVLTAVAAEATRGPSAFSTSLIVSIAGVGSLAGSFLAPAVSRRVEARRVILGITWVSACLVPLMAIAPSALWVGALLAGCCVLAPIANVVMGSARMALTPDHLQGRVQSASGLVAGCAAPLGPLAGGLLLDRAGPAVAYLSFGAVMAVLAVVSVRSRGLHLLPSFRAASTPVAPAGAASIG